MIPNCKCLCMCVCMYTCIICICLVIQSCLTLCDPLDCSLLGSSVHGDSPGKNTGVGCHALLQGVFLTQGSNLGLLHCRQRRILYHLSHQGKPSGQNGVALTDEPETTGEVTPSHH